MSDLLPPSARPSERAVSLTLGRVFDVATPVRELRDPAACPAHILPFLAWAESVDDWDPAWPDDRKRAVIAASRSLHEHKGTIGAIKTAIDLLDYGAVLIEWFAQTPPAAPFTFVIEITVDQVGIPTAAVFDQLAAAATAAKNLRSHMTGVNVDGRSEAALAIGGAAQLCETITINPVP